MSAQCDDVRERLAADDESGAPDLAARARVDEHLATCDACRAVAGSLREIDDVLVSMPPIAPPAALSRA
ncbi:MAG: zf-HC2 domain-containing protein, partial [Myxococcota bacterium]|nr:zf-HC2 domain-containing protein [Myxococcota bacterium]